MASKSDEVELPRDGAFAIVSFSVAVCLAGISCTRCDLSPGGRGC